MAAATVAGVYATALLEVADERGSRAQVVQDCRDLTDSLTHDHLASLDDPRLGKVHAKAALTGLFTGKLAKETLDLLLLLVDRNRLADAPAIVRETVRLAEEQVGLKRIQVTTATPLSPAVTESLRLKLKERLQGSSVVMVSQVDPALIGGITFRLDDLFIDGSVRRHLGEMRRVMLAAPLPSKQMWVQ
jgi:F-type H+-transporting ATPase subunit delta